MRKIIYTRPDGGLSVVSPCEGARLAFAVVLADGTRHAAEEQVLVAAENRTIVKAVPVDRVFRRWPVSGAVAEWAETEDEFLARVAARSVPDNAVGMEIVDESAIPTDRTFRDAWKQNGSVVEHDMPKAREIHKGRLRHMRAPLLSALDVEYQRADERGDAAEKLRIAARKQALRDVTVDAAIDAAQTPEELKSAIPEALK